MSEFTQNTADAAIELYPEMIAMIEVLNELLPNIPEGTYHAGDAIVRITDDGTLTTGTERSSTNITINREESAPVLIRHHERQDDKGTADSQNGLLTVENGENSLSVISSAPGIWEINENCADNNGEIEAALHTLQALIQNRKLFDVKVRQWIAGVDVEGKTQFA